MNFLPGPEFPRYDRLSHLVYMSFFFRHGWQVQFQEADLRTPLAKKLTFTDPGKSPVANHRIFHMYYT